MAKLIGFDPATHLEDEPKFRLGEFYEAYTSTSGGVVCLFRYVRFVDVATVAIARGNNLFWSDNWIPATPAGQYTVTADYSECLGDVAQYIGTALNAPAANQYGFIQVRGPGYVLHNNDNDGAIMSEVIQTAADNGVANVGAQTLLLGIGVGLEAVVAATDLQLVMIQCHNLA